MFFTFLAELHRLRSPEETGASNVLQKIGITTNGIVLARKVDVLKEAGLDSINISLDTLNPARFQLITRRNGFSHVMKGIEAAINSEFFPVKVCCAFKQGLRSLMI